VDPLFYSIVISAAALIIISLLTKPMPQDHIDNCFRGFGIRKQLPPQKIGA
jgi:hypothetical protein